MLSFQTKSKTRLNASKMLRQLCFITVAAALCVGLSSGCSCIFRQLNTTYFDPYYTRMVTATVVRSSQNAHYRTYSFNVDTVYKGCPLNKFTAKTPVSSATCGITLSVGTTYFVPLADQSGKFSISLCDVSLKTSPTNHEGTYGLVKQLLPTDIKTSFPPFLTLIITFHRFQLMFLFF